MVVSDGTPKGLVGNLAGDFVRGVDVASMPRHLQDGVALHRAVDRFTDAHPLVMQSRARLPQRWRHYRGVLVDVFYDHFLARDFESHVGEPLDGFAGRVYTALRDQHETLPPRLQRAAPAMIEHDWLRAYAHVEGLEAVLRGMSRRARREVALDAATADLREHYAAFERDFAEFFPQLRRFASRASM
ncbi:MAG: DUF479 domain-containing protein [Planctomycetes bacterium]|nr:DUF479 domain-containing protein [Planctomycetota bacterium]